MLMSAALQYLQQFSVWKNMFEKKSQMFHCDQQGVVEANEYHTKNEGKTKSKEQNWRQNHYVNVFDLSFTHYYVTQGRRHR